MVYVTHTPLSRALPGLHATAKDLFLILAGSVALALASRIALYLPLSPVPITAQTLMVFAIGALLGSRRGALSVLAYVVEGAAGLPVFAAGNAGLIYMLGPTGGYIVGFVAAAFVVGWYAEKYWHRKTVTILLALIIASVAIYAPGLLWLARFVGLQRAVAAGLLPFIPGDTVKLLLAAMVLPQTRHYASRMLPFA